ncbi:MAG: hypothetical protein ABI612_22335 [Betaproteobacteria bacterium]
MLWIDDANGNLGAVDVATVAANVIGNTEQFLTLRRVKAHWR